MLAFRASTQKNCLESVATQVLDCSWSCPGNLSVMFKKNITLDANNVWLKRMAMEEEEI